jgi:hypothetical protein
MRRGEHYMAKVSGESDLDFSGPRTMVPLHLIPLFG